MNKIELLNYWLNLTKFDENQTSFKIFSKDWKFNENNKKMIKFFNEWDDSGTTSLLYAKFMFLDLIKIQTITIFDLLENNIDNLDEFKYLYNKFNSNEFKELESDLILAFEQILSKLNNKKLNDVIARVNTNAISDLIESGELNKYGMKIIDPSELIPETYLKQIQSMMSSLNSVTKNDGAKKFEIGGTEYFVRRGSGGKYILNWS
jgi:hypothetical protein